MYSQCVYQYVDRIGPSICFTEWYFLWDLYSQKWWCHPSALHIEEPYWSHHHSFFNCFWFSYFRKPLPNAILNFYCFWFSYFRKPRPNDIFYFWMPVSITPLVKFVWSRCNRYWHPKIKNIIGPRFYEVWKSETIEI